MSEFLMPKLGADMTAGRLVAWRKRPGDIVHRGDIVADVETDKGVIEVEIFASGTIERLLAEPGQMVPVGAPLALVSDGEWTPASPADAAASPAVPTSAVQAPAAAPSPAVALRPTVAVDFSRLRISPSARRLARELGVDPSQLTGTGASGAIMREDIERAAKSRTTVQTTAPSVPAPSAATPTAVVAKPPQPATDRAAAMRQAIAAAMGRSKREIPHYYLSTTIDMHQAMSWLEAENVKRPMAKRLLYGTLLVKAVALALREVPELNATWQGDHVELSSAIHVGVAISLRQGGLVAPALHDTDRLSLDELMSKLLDLVTRTRSGKLRSSELADPTITVTSLGEQGVEAVFGVIYPPQVALVGFGKLVERPWSVAGQVISRRVVTATLSADHRVSDGHRGALFLAAVDRLLQQPERL